MKADLFIVFGGKAGNGIAARVLELIWPFMPVLTHAPGGTFTAQSLETAVVLQCITPTVTEAVEVFMQGMSAAAKAFIEGSQQLPFRLGRRWPVNQRQVLQALKLRLQAGLFHRCTQGAFTQYGAGGAIQTVEEQAAGRRVGAIALGVAGEHGVDWADCQSICTPFPRRTGCR